MTHGAKVVRTGARFNSVLPKCLSEAAHRLDPLLFPGQVNSAPEARELAAPAGVLRELIDSLSQSSAYDDIVVLAGRNAILELNPQLSGLQRMLLRKQSARIEALSAAVMPLLLGEATLDLQLRGRVLFASLSCSIFATGPERASPACGFYGGAFLELCNLCGVADAHVHEVVCRAMDPFATCCLFHVEL
jgi:hypothetical protein